MSTATNSATDEKEKIWKWIEARLWQNTESGVYYERPVVNGRPTFRSLKTKNRKHAVEELFRRRSAVGAGEDPYAEPALTTVGDVIRRYQKDGYLDRDLQPRPAGTLADEERHSNILLEFWDRVDVTTVTDATCDKYRDWRKKRVQQGTGERAIDRELNTLNNAFRYTGPLPPVILTNRYPATPDHFLDAARADFLRRLESAQIALSPWEEGFVENNIGRVCYSTRQRIVIDGMRAKYDRLPRG